MLPGSRSLGLATWAVVGLVACGRPSAEQSPSPGAARLLIPEADLGRQARKLLASLKSDPYVYFRFINRPWAAATCAALGPDLVSVPHVHLHGDAHVNQYAYTRTDHGLDDLDDTGGGPAALDVVRFLGSVVLVTRARGWIDARDELFDAFFQGYRRALVDRDYRPPVPSYVVRMRETLVHDELDFLQWAESLMEPVAGVDDAAIEEGRLRLAEYVTTQRPELPSFFLEPKRIGWLRMGVGSALTPKLLLRTEGRTRAAEDDFLLEARELSDLSGVSCVDIEASERAVRIIEGYGRLGRIRHDLVVVIPGPPEPEHGSREWWARSWEASYREIQLDLLASPRELAEIVHDAGAQLGHGHAWTPEGDPGSGDSGQALEWVDRSEPRLRTLSIQMAHDLLEAWEVFKRDSTDTAGARSVR
jgi:hypothetical protein